MWGTSQARNLTILIQLGSFLRAQIENRDLQYKTGLPWWLSNKESTCNARDVGSVPWPGRSPGEGDGEGNTRCSIVDWRIPWIEEPSALQSVQLERVGYDWTTEHTRRHRRSAAGLARGDFTLHTQAVRTELASIAQSLKTDHPGQDQEGPWECTISVSPLIWETRTQRH